MPKSREGVKKIGLPTNNHKNIVKAVNDIKKHCQIISQNVQLISTICNGRNNVKIMSMVKDELNKITFPPNSFKIVPKAIQLKAKRRYSYTCPICVGTDTFVSNWTSTDAHIRREHTRVAKGHCVICEKTFYNKDSLRSHEKKCNK